MRALKSKLSSLTQRAVICALALLCVTKPGEALPSHGQLALYEHAPEHDRVGLLIQLAKAGQVEDVRYLLNAHPLTGSFAANRSLFIDGLLLKADGDYTGAAQKFRDALAADPGLTMVRAELASTLVILEEDESAKHHLQLLASEAPDEETASGLRSFIDQVDARKPYTVSGFLAVAPSSNLNGGSQHKTVYIPNNPIFSSIGTTRPESGVGLLAGVNAGFSRRLGNDFSFVAAADVEARLYKNADYNSYSLSQSAEIRRLVSLGYFGLGIVSSQMLDTDKIGISYLSYGPRVSASLQVSAKNRLNGDVIYEIRDTIDKAVTDSTSLMVNASWTHGFNSSFSASLFGSFEHLDTDFDPTSYNAFAGGVSVYKELSHGITANVTGRLGSTTFEGVNGIIGNYREDKKLMGSIEFTKRDLNLWGFAPSMKYSYTQNFSNLDIYDISTHAIDFRLTKDF